MRFVMKRPGRKWKIIETEGGERSIKKIVRGNYVLWEISERVGIVCNARGYALGMPFCCTFKKYRLYGDVLIVGLEDGGFTDVPYEVEDLLARMMVPAV